MDATFTNFAALCIDDEDFADGQTSPPTFRSVGLPAFDAWGAGINLDQPALHMRCTSAAAAWEQWSLEDVQSGLLGDAPAPRLVIALTPHRTEGEDRLVCSTRQFTMAVTLVDGTTGAPVQGCDGQDCRVSLVYADTGELVPAQRGEPPLAGETVGKRLANGACLFRPKVAALSYHHGRRSFAVRVEADLIFPGATASTPVFACSPPIRGVARLPNEPKTANGSRITPAQGTHGNGVSQCGDGAPPAADWERPSSADICVVAENVDGEVDEVDEDDEFRFENDAQMMKDDGCSSLAPVPVTSGGGSFTYTSHMNLLDELQVQQNMLAHVNAQQQYMLNELAKLGSRPPPPAASAASAGSAQHAPFRATAVPPAPFRGDTTVCA